MESIPVKMKDMIFAERTQFLFLIGISIVIFAFTCIVYFRDNLIFQRFIGKINPITAILMVIVFGFILLSFMLSQKWFAICNTGNLQGVYYGAGLAIFLALIMILVDTKIVFPADMNIRFPESLLFYPAIGFLVEILFHVLPLAIILVILNSFFKNVNFDYIVWISIFLIVLLEPIYHTINMASLNRYPLWAIMYVGFHIFLINFIQLIIFRKYDFISMYSFRLAYYVVWHIVWGYLRLKWLF